MSPGEDFPRLLSRRSLLAGAIALTGVGVGVAMPLRTQGRYYPGVTVEDVDLSDTTPSEADALLRARFLPLEQRAITFRYGDQAWNASLADLGMSVDYTAMEALAWDHGRDDGLVNRYLTMANQADPTTIPLILKQDESGLDNFLGVIAQSTDVEARNAILVRRSGQVDIIKDVVGARLDGSRARQDVAASLRIAKPGEVTVSTVAVAPDVTADALEGAREDAVKLVSAPVTIRDGNQTWEISEDDLAGALRVPRDQPARLASDALLPALTAIAEELREEPTNVVLGWDGGLYVIDDDIDGREVDLEKLTSLVAEAAASEEREVDAPMVTLRAEARADNVDELGIDKMIAEGSSSFAGSSESRAENVRVAAGHASNHLVAPGTQFSFNDAIGPISTDNGYVEGKIIQGDWTASDLGGGVCQVSTTVFRSALFAGFKFDEWNFHSWRLAFYEADGSPPGEDAAIYQPNDDTEWELDLKFTNSLKSWLLLQMVVDGDTARAQLFSSPLDYTVDIPSPEVSNPVKPGSPVDRVNPELASATRNKVQNAVPGYLVKLTRRILDLDGNELERGVFESDYEPQREVWEVAPGELRNTPEATEPPT